MAILGGLGPYRLPPGRLFKLIAATRCIFYKPPGLELSMEKTDHISFQISLIKFKYGKNQIKSLFHFLKPDTWSYSIIKLYQQECRVNAHRVFGILELPSPRNSMVRTTALGQTKGKNVGIRTFMSAKKNLFLDFYFNMIIKNLWSLVQMLTKWSRYS
jgi:hypothetical protein